MKPARARRAAIAILLPILTLVVFVAGCRERKVSDVTGSGAIDIVSVTAQPDTILLNQQSVLTVLVDNPDGQELQYNWAAYYGTISGTGPQVRYFGSYCCTGVDFIILTVTDEDGGRVQEYAYVYVIGATE